MCSLSVFGILSYCIHWITDVLNFPLLLPLQSTTATSNYNNYIAFFQTEQQSFCAQAQNIFFHEFFAFFLFLSAIFFYRPSPPPPLFCFKSLSSFVPYFLAHFGLPLSSTIDFCLLLIGRLGRTTNALVCYM